MTSSVLLITDVLFARTWAMVGAALTAATFVAFSFALGGIARLRERRG